MRIPLIPLGSTVVLPHGLHAMTVVDPAVLAVLERATREERHVALGQLRAGGNWQDGAVHRTVTIVRILFADDLPDGRRNVMFEGVQRARLLSQEGTGAVHAAEVQPLVDLMPEEDMPRIREAARRMVALAAQAGQSNPAWQAAFANIENRLLHPSVIADYLASHIVGDHYERQCLLEERRVLRRVELTNVQLRAVLAGPQKAPHAAED